MWRHWVVSVCLCVCDSSADNEGRTFGDWDVGWIAGENSLCVSSPFYKQPKIHSLMLSLAVLKFVTRPHLVPVGGTVFGHRTFWVCASLSLSTKMSDLLQLKTKVFCSMLHIEGWTIEADVDDTKRLKSFFSHNDMIYWKYSVQTKLFQFPGRGASMLAVPHTADFLNVFVTRSNTASSIMH